MKVSELLQEMETKGSWKIQNLSGNFKTFKDKESPDAMAWIKNRGTAKQVWDKASGKWIEDPKQTARDDKKLDREERRAEREEARVARGPKYDLKLIYNKAIDMIGNSFPDGDPIDQIGDWFKKTYGTADNCREIVDKAMRKFGGGLEKKGMYEYLADMWEEHAADLLSDAVQLIKKGAGVEAAEEAAGDYDHFLAFDKDGNPSLGNNPWLTTDEQKKSRAKHVKEYKIMVAQMNTVLKKKEKEQK